MIRREFLAIGAAALLARRTAPIRIGVIGDGTSAARGARLGAEEGAHTARLLGREVDVAEDDTNVVACVLTSAGARASGPAIAAYREQDCSERFRVLHPSSDALAWHPSLEKYGAAQLNDRFRHRFGTGMDEYAWAGWFAAKCVIESALRSRDVTAHLLGARTHFDGHKGTPLRFHPRTRALIHPIYRLVNGQPIDAGLAEVTCRSW